MNLTKKITILVLFISVGSLILLQLKFKSEITSAIDKKLPSNIKLNYTNLSTNVFTGSIRLDSLSTKIFDKHKNVVTAVNAKSLNLSGFSLWQFVFNKTIFINNIIFENPDIQYFQIKKNRDELKSNESSKEFNKAIVIDKISFVNGSFIARKEDSLLASMDNIHLNFIGFSTDSHKLKEKIPFNYKDYKFSGKEIFMNMSPYESLKIEGLSADNGKLNLQNLFIKPKFTKQELSRKIVIERDHIQLRISELSFVDLHFGFTNSRFYFNSSLTNMVKPKLKVFRDKRVADDLSIKSMYSKMLRDLSFDFTISRLEANQGYISYSERVKDTDEAGTIFFKNINTKISSLSNIHKDNKKIKILADSDFMGSAPMRLTITFDVKNKSDEFLALGQFKNFNATAANSFFESNLNAKTKGEIEQLYFTFNGNNTYSKGDFKIKYKDFKFEILNNKNQVNKVLTTIGNIFINDGSKTDKDGFRHGTIEVKRNKTKSFFNYIWLNVQDGLINSLTGNGQKK